MGRKDNMSYTEVYRISNDGKLEAIAELRNSHGFGPFVWSAVSAKYFGDEFGWMAHAKEIWPLWEDPRLPKHWSAALLVTYDNAVIEYDKFILIAKMLREFVSDVGKRDRVCHLLEIADLLEKSKSCKGICFYGTSLSENPWEETYDFEKGDKHFFVGNL